MNDFVKPAGLSKQMGRLRGALLSSVVLIAAGCDSSLMVPEGSEIQLTVGSDVLAADGGLTQISALVTESDGALPRDGTRVVFIASGGTLCVTGVEEEEEEECAWAPIVTAETDNGVASATLKAGAGSTITLDARSGGVEATTRTITVSSLAAPAGASVILESDPDTVVVGVAATVRAYLATQDGAPVPDNTRVVLTAASGTLSNQIILTRSGFADAAFRAEAAGDAVVYLRSGPVSGQVTITVVPAGQ